MRNSRYALRVVVILVTAMLLQFGQQASAVTKRPGGASAGRTTCGCLCYGKTGWCKPQTTDGKCTCSKDPVYPCSGTCTQEKIKN
jgi:hypothetical protein